MNLLREKQKTEAIKRMKALKLKYETIKDFEDGIVNISNYSDKSTKPNKKMLSYIRKIENMNEWHIYHIICTKIRSKKWYYLLYISDFEEEWEDDWEWLGKNIVEVMRYDNRNTESAIFDSFAVSSIEGVLVMRNY